MKARGSFVKKLSGSLQPSPFTLPVTAQGRRDDSFCISVSPFPSNPNTGQQQIIRARYRACVAGWVQQTEDERLAWKNYADGINLPNYQAFMKDCVSNVLPWQWWARFGSPNASRDCYSLNWAGLSWKVGNRGANKDHMCFIWHVFFSRTGTPPNLIASIRNATAGGLPTGADLVKVICDVSEVAEDPELTGYDITFPPLLVRMDTRYALCLRSPAGDASNLVKFWYSGISPGAVDDKVIYSTDGGLNWNSVLLAMNYAAEYGVLLVKPP